ncbi:hypothetical protein LAG90_02715 [Marinilongibacter aquaticus]|uniref:AVAST type 1 anti-phage system protein Avs1c n=1 Tax=Autumnicola tepida TaxID=3075595 RepID=A0ABU3C5M1_9FLAO|nr:MULTISPECIES: AVAST type 1 anti-phage system protein Avs1c [Bacteroidota]MDT0641625.1 AVAST type 1 anti-phage system protein Avs1c [Zunongwangia sp. F363]UBM59567.1 hypothetical protein LAG90_02715 [Marinilongibacter aquaticus]
MPDSRKEFEYNMYMFLEKLERGQVHISRSNTRTIKGIINARYAPNKRVNLHTIDEMARLMANSIANMMQHKQLKPEDEGEE